MGALVLVEEDRGIRTLTLNRPEKLNALSEAMVEELSVRLGDAATDHAVRVVVIAGSGRSFCAGYDLDEDEPGDRELILAGLRHSLDRLLEVFDHPRPVIAQVHGHCLAGGCDLMMMCDFALASEDAVFGQPEIRFGSTVLAHVMPWLIGARRAKELLLTGTDRLSADEAERMGLINRVVPLAMLREETMTLARQLAVIDPEVMAHTKRAINAAWEAAGFREALIAGVEIGARIETEVSPERARFREIAATEGLKAAIAWRDSRFQSSGH